MENWTSTLLPAVEITPASGAGITLPFIKSIVHLLQPDYSITDIQTQWNTWGIIQAFDEKIELNRRTVSILTDKILNPFAMEIDWDGRLTE